MGVDHNRMHTSAINKFCVIVYVSVISVFMAVYSVVLP